MNDFCLGVALLAFAGGWFGAGLYLWCTERKRIR